MRCDAVCCFSIVKGSNPARGTSRYGAAWLLSPVRILPGAHKTWATSATGRLTIEACYGL
jgi:hypothetical protein